MSTPTQIEPSHLPATIQTYLTAHAAGEAAVAAGVFTPDAVVVDDGHTYRGSSEVLDFLNKAGGEYSYTTELIGAEHVDDQHWVAINRLEGDFPGGLVDLRYRFALDGERIAELVIAP